MRPALLALLAATSVVSHSQTAFGPNPPRLTVVISIDQFRNDYTERFAPYFLPASSGSTVGGFNYLLQGGAVYRDAHHGHVPTETGPGHATLLTGSEPSLNGIVANAWIDPLAIDWASGKRPSSVYCASDPETGEVNGGGKMSPRNLKVTTVGDELKLATGGKAKVVGIAFKDRASIFMAGHAADTVIWTNGNGGWASSTHYCPTGKLPAWVDKLNADKPFDAFVGKAWEPLLPAEAYALSRKAPAEKAPPAGKVFSHEVGAEANKAYYGAVAVTGFGNDIVGTTVERALDAESLGQDDVPDLLVINLSSNDYVGHRYGPNSPEVLDVTVRTDRMLSKLFNAINAKVKGGLRETVIVITADHGVVPIPEESAKEAHTEAARYADSAVEKAIEAALAAKFGAGDWCVASMPHIYLNRPLIGSKALDPATVQRAAAEAAMTVPGIYGAVAASDVWTGRVPQVAWGQLVSNSYNPRLSGDVFVFETPGAYFGSGTGTGHGSPWNYDSHVPILMRGKGIEKGKHSERVFTNAIAPTLSHLLGVEYPTGCMGTVLPGALKD